MELFLCFEVQVDIGEKKAFWRREGRKSRVSPMWFFGRATMRENSISIPWGVDCDKISTLNKLIMSFFSVTLSGWISGYKKTKSPNGLEVCSEGQNYFCLVIIPATMVKIVWFTLFITCGSLGSSFYNENVIKFISKLDSSLNILWDFLSKGKIATLHLIKYIIFG